MVNKVKAGLLACVGCLLLGTSAEAAGNTIMLLVRQSLNNVPDSSGSSDLWQYEGGIVQNAAGTATIGHYLANRRITSSGTSTDNTAGETISLFFSNATAGDVPYNITFQGAYSYNTGQFAGSVSAASSRYHPLIGDSVTGTLVSGGATKITIDFDGNTSVP
jgi:hypothetical protein